MTRPSELNDLAHEIALSTAELDVCMTCRGAADGWWRLPDSSTPEIEHPDSRLIWYLELRGAIEYDELRRHARLVGPKESSLACTWTQANDHGEWQTACGNAFLFTDDDTPSGHGLKFCCYCAGLWLRRRGLSQVTRN